MAEKLDEKEITTTERDKLILKQLKFHEIILACSLPKYSYSLSVFKLSASIRKYYNVF